MSENSDEPPVNKQEKAIHHFYMVNKLSICLCFRLFQNSVYCLVMFYSIHSHYCLFKE